MDNQKELARFSSGPLIKGINVYEQDIDPDLDLLVGTYNVTQGLSQGLGPRYGVAPIPGQSDTVVTTGQDLNGLMAAEGSAGQGYRTRTKILGIVQLRLLDYELAEANDFYAYVVLRSPNGSDSVVDVVLGSSLSGTVYEQAARISAGLPPTSSLASGSGGIYSQGYEPLGIALKHATSGDYVSIIQEFLTLNGLAPNFGSVATYSYSGPAVNNFYLLGKTLTDPTATAAPNINFNLFIASVARPTMNGGTPSQYQFNKFTNGVRNVQVAPLGVNGNISANGIYSYSINPPDIYGPSLNYSQTDVNAAFASQAAATAATSIPSPGSSQCTLLIDRQNTIDSSYKAIFCAVGKKAICSIIQEWDRNILGTPMQYINLTSSALSPPTLATVDVGSTTDRYTEATSNVSMPVSTCFYAFEPFILGTATAGPNGICTSKNGGIFQPDTDYEITYSHYYKNLNYETNVGAPAKFETPAAAATTGIGLSFQLTITDAAIPPISTTQVDRMAQGSGTIMPNIFSDPNYIRMNFLEYRFYYRVVGTFEWLPCAVIDASELYGSPSGSYYKVGIGPIAGTTGGQPGGFNDYSNLPDDSYLDVKIFKNRSFWCSEKAIYFSRKNNILAYPASNSVAATVGRFRGMTVHNYPGQAEQNSRLIIWGTEETYVGRFTGDPLIVPVQVSPDSIGTYPLDGSDFVIDPWTSVTAFSHRAAVVAEGILYFWGPRGIYRDDGVNTPTRISVILEPDLFNFYDPASTNEIHGSYNQTTREIIWYYPPKPGSAEGFQTHGIVYNTNSETYLYTRYRQKIDASWNLEVTSDETGIAGQRAVIAARSSPDSDVQRAYFFDQNNRSGDMWPGTEMLVSAISTPASGQRTLTLAAGYDAAAVSSIRAGDFIAVDQFYRYTGSTAGENLIATVVSVAAPDIVIELPDDAAFPDELTLSRATYLPIYHKAQNGEGLNGIPWSLKTSYWAPGGLSFWAYWLFCYMLLKLKLWPSRDTQTFSFGHRTPISAGMITQDIVFEENSDGCQQIYHMLEPGDQNFEGNAIQYHLTGTHIGNEWVLQYLEAHAQQLDGDQLKIFESRNR